MASAFAVLHFCFLPKAKRMEEANAIFLSLLLFFFFSSLSPLSTQVTRKLPHSLRRKKFQDRYVLIVVMPVAVVVVIM